MDKNPNMDVKLADRPLEELVDGARVELQSGSDQRPMLVALHQRADRPTFDKAGALLMSEEGVDRRLGALILRELGPWRAPRFAADAVPLLRDSLARESEVDVRAALLGALAMQGDATALDELLRYAGAAEEEMRRAVAWNLDGYIGPLTEPDPRVLEALAGLTDDDDPEIRYSAVYDLAHWAPADPLAVSALARHEDDPDNAVAFYSRLGLARSDAGWHVLCQARERRDVPVLEVRFGLAEEEWFALRPIGDDEDRVTTVLVLRGSSFNWSGEASIGRRRWVTWARRVGAFHGGLVKTASLRDDRRMTLRLTRHAEGVAQLEGLLAPGFRGHWYERLTWRWQLTEAALATAAESARVVGDFLDLG